MIAAKQNRELAPGDFLRLFQIMNFGSNTFRLMLVVFATPDANRFAVAVLAPEFFQMCMRVFLNQLIRAAKNASGATVILFKFYNF